MGKKRICLDPGHYGEKYNAGVVSGYYESATVWKLTQYEKEYLEQKPFCFAAYRITGNHPECQNNRRNHYLKQYLFHAILLHTYHAAPPADNNDLS